MSYKEKSTPSSWLGILLGCVGVVSLAGILIVVGVALKGLVLMQLWNWFLVPFLGLPAIPSVLWAYALYLSISFVASHAAGSTHKDDRESNEKIGSMIGSLVLSPLIVLLIGYIIKLLLF